MQLIWRFTSHRHLNLAARLQVRRIFLKWLKRTVLIYQTTCLVCIQVDKMRRLCIIRCSSLVQCNSLFLKLVYLAHVHVVYPRLRHRLTIRLTFLMLRHDFISMTAMVVLLRLSILLLGIILIPLFDSINFKLLRCAIKILIFQAHLLDRIGQVVAVLGRLRLKGRGLLLDGALGFCCTVTTRHLL